MSEKQMAIMRNVRFGVTDRGGVALSFSAYLNESSAADQYMGCADAEKFIKAYGVSDVGQLAGRPVWVDADAHMITNPRPCVIK